MTQEEKELLLKDLCARLTHGVKAYVKNWSKLDRKYYEGVYTVESIHPSLNNIFVYSKRFSVEVIVGYDDYEIKPYLFPLSSMTEEIMDEIYTAAGVYDINRDSSVHIEVGTTFKDLTKISDILHKHHIDYRGLIPMGLAIDATGLNIY
jgi:hypothetical protein